MKEEEEKNHENDVMKEQDKEKSSLGENSFKLFEKEYQRA